MTIERTGMSRRRLLTTAAVGVPAMGVLGAVNLLGAPAAKAARLPVDGVWGWGDLEGSRVLPQSRRVPRRQPQRRRTDPPPAFLLEFGEFRPRIGLGVGA